MRKIIFLVLCLFSLAANAQKIAADNVQSDGSRAIFGELVNVRSFSDKVVFKVGLSAVVIDNRTEYSLMVEATSNTPYKINEGMKLLLKDKNQEVISLSANSNYDATLGNVQSIGGMVFTTYSTIAFYTIPTSDIEKICNGVFKLRQENTVGTYDKEFKKDKIGKAIKKEYELIQKALATPKSFNDF